MTHDAVKVDAANGKIKLPTLESIDLKGNPYVKVITRLQYFRETYPAGRIKTEVTLLEASAVIVRAQIWATKESDPWMGHSYTQLGQPKALEKAESIAIGRAFAIGGIGIVGADDIASADEMTEYDREITKAEVQTVQDRMQTSPIAVKGFFSTLKDKGVTERSEAYLVLNAVNEKWQKLNTTGITSVQKKLDNLEEFDIEQILLAAPHE